MQTIHNFDIFTISLLSLGKDIFVRRESSQLACILILGILLHSSLAQHVSTQLRF